MGHNRDLLFRIHDSCRTTVREQGARMLGRTALGKYRLLRFLGGGSNAEVYLAEPLRYPNFRVVVKRIRDHIVGHPKFRQQFEAEVRSMANFAHPYAVKFLDAALDDPLGPCLVMEYVPGVTLEALIERHRRLPPERVGRLLGYLGHALQAAHDAGIIHRDLKPANLMVTDADTPAEAIKVMDFGFAGFTAKPHIQLAELTGHGPIYAIGTPGYVSPEMIRGDRVDTRSDLYSVGVILYELLASRLPFEYDDQDKLLAAHVQLSPPAFRKLGRGDVPPGVEAAVQLALAKYPNERPQTARELVELFGHGLGENYWDQTAPAGWEPPTRSAVMKGLPFAEPIVDEEPDDPYRLTRRFEVVIPERLAAAKLRGFVEDVGGQVLASEPGLIRMWVGVPRGFRQTPVPAKGSGLLAWFGGLRKPAVPRGHEPIEIELHMDKPDPQQNR
ncbi:MAG: serine/threonine protein kinase, partial [Gemmataceae bacterium]|nr:serine/threonine protein kinase [Gemmataceae bacterium]